MRRNGSSCSAISQVIKSVDPDGEAEPNRSLMSDTLRRQAEELTKRIGVAVRRTGRPIRIMEVCGTHTVSLRRNGIHSMLPDSLSLISGPGCPVCVTPVGYIDNALSLLERPGVEIATFGDMVKIPGSDGRSLATELGTRRVRIVYSPAQLARISREAYVAGHEVVFLAIGFETTIPTVARALADAAERNDETLSFYTACKRVQPALEALLADDQPDRHRIDGFLLPGHVAIVIGEVGFAFLPPFGVSGVITGFEPLEMLTGIAMLTEAIESGSTEVKNAYPAVVRRDGNRKARELMFQVFRPAEAIWRGLGRIPESGLSIRNEYERFDAARRYGLGELDVPDPDGCRCGEVITGRATPVECPLFGTGCTPDDPVGPCMVSSEGTCSAYLKYGDATV